MTLRLATPEDRAWYAATVPTGELRAAWTSALFRLAHDRVVPGAAVGVDGLRPEQFTPGRLEPLRRAVLGGAWTPRPLLRRTIHGGSRPREIGIPTLDDQVVLAALHLLLDPALDRRLHDHVWGFRVGRDRHGAVRALCAGVARGALVRADIRRMFESLDHARLRSAVRRCWPDPLAAEVVDRVLGAWQTGLGVPTGASISPVLSNAYLHVGLDQWIAGGHAQAPVGLETGQWADVAASLLGLLSGPGRAARRFVAAARYADDFALLCDGDGRAALAELARAVGACGLTLHPEKQSVHRLEYPKDWPARVLGYDLTPRRVRGGWMLAPVGA